MWSAVALAVAVFIGSVIGVTQEMINHLSRTEQVANDESEASVAVTSGLNIAREALKTDGVWGDCSGADRECDKTDEYGAYPLYSATLGKAIVDYPVGMGKVTVKLKPIDPDTVVVFVEGKSGKGKIDVAVKFKRGASTGKLPLVYTPNGNMYDGYDCSYYWDGEKLAGVTKPNFTIYFNKNFYHSAEIINPDDPAGDNPKDVEFFTNFSTEVLGYQNIDKVYTTGDLYLKNGAHLKLAYADGSVYLEDGSSADKIVEDGNFDFPELNEEFPDLDVNDNPPPGVTSYRTIYCTGSMTLPDNVYVDRLYLFSGCQLNINGKVWATAVYTYTFFRQAVINLNEGGHFIVTAHKIGWSSRERINFNGGKMETVATEVDEGAVLRIKANNGVADYKSEVFANYGGGVIGLNSDGNADPASLLIDANEIYAASYYGSGSNPYIIATLLARKNMEAVKATIIGNIFAEKLASEDLINCNVVNRYGKQRIAFEEDFYNLIAPDGISVPSDALEEIAKVICKDESCLNNL